jgi:hypothetical protein
LLVVQNALKIPETIGHSPRRFCCYSGQLLYCSGACEGALSKHLDAANMTKTAPLEVKSRKNLATPVENCRFSGVAEEQAVFELR